MFLEKICHRSIFPPVYESVMFSKQCRRRYSTNLQKLSKKTKLMMPYPFWAFKRRVENIQNVFWLSYARQSYVLRPEGCLIFYRKNVISTGLTWICFFRLIVTGYNGNWFFVLKNDKYIAQNIKFISQFSSFYKTEVNWVLFDFIK